jgi:DNA polymerase III subunit epsilon
MRRRVTPRNDRNPARALGRPVAFVDVETTGFHPHRGDRIVEVAALRIEPDGTTRRLRSLVQPFRPIPPGASDVHGIEDGDVADAPPFSEVAGPLERVLREAVLIAHNAPFDLGFLAWHFAFAGRHPVRLTGIDTLAMARALYGMGGNALPALARRFGIRARSSHRALGDVLTLQGVLPRLVREWGRRTSASARTSWRAIRRFTMEPWPEPPLLPLPRILRPAIRGARPVRFEYRAPGKPRRLWGGVVPIECATCAGGWVVRVHAGDPSEVTQFRVDRLRRLALR